jgi:hypothetical protein
MSLRLVKEKPLPNSTVRRAAKRTSTCLPYSARPQPACCGRRPARSRAGVLRGGDAVYAELGEWGGWAAVRTERNLNSISRTLFFLQQFPHAQSSYPYIQVQTQSTESLRIRSRVLTNRVVFRACSLDEC